MLMLLGNSKTMKTVQLNPAPPVPTIFLIQALIYKSKGPQAQPSTGPFGAKKKNDKKWFRVKVCGWKPGPSSALPQLRALRFADLEIEATFESLMHVMIWFIIPPGSGSNLYSPLAMVIIYKRKTVQFLQRVVKTKMNLPVGKYNWTSFSQEISLNILSLSSGHSPIFSLWFSRNWPSLAVYWASFMLNGPLTFSTTFFIPSTLLEYS